MRCPGFAIVPMRCFLNLQNTTVLVVGACLCRRMPCRVFNQSWLLFNFRARVQLGNLMYSCFTAKCFAYSLLSPQLNNNNDRASSETGGVYVLIYISSGRRLPSIASNSLKNHFSSPIFPNSTRPPLN